ncbi:hypothetical protein vseg_009404 [Gypsophila vaccaria]
MANTTATTTQIFIKLPTNKTLTLQFPPNFPITPQSISNHLQTLTLIPPQLTLTLNGRLISSSTQTVIPNYSTLSLSAPLRGGKGGFGSLLRGAGTKAGQKKTNNFDACRDMSGRRLRHVNADKKIEEWRAEEEERKLAKTAEKFLNDLAKKGKGGRRDDGAEKYVDKYRADSARCVQEVEVAVREAAALSLKRKGDKEGGVEAKKLKIWMGKRKVEDSDSDDSSEGGSESDDSDTENEKSAVTDNGSQSDSSKDGSNGSLLVPKLGAEQRVEGATDSGSGEENETRIGDSVEKDANANGSNSQSDGDGHTETSSDEEANLSGKPCVSVSADVTASSPQIVSDQPASSSTLVKVDDKVHGDSECKSLLPDNAVNVCSNVPEASQESQPLNFDDFSSSSELEILGMERLKSELQARGLKCGGTLQERAARLFLLKTTPLEKLPKKLLAKK